MAQPNRAIGSALNMLSSLEEDIVSLLAAIPTHLEENNSYRVKQIAKNSMPESQQRQLV